jgi:membrane protein
MTIVAWPRRRLWPLLKASLNGWWQDNVPRMGASLAYYTLFALAPVLILVIALGGLLFGPDAVRGEIVAQIQGLIGMEGAKTIQSMLEAAGRATPRLAVTIGAALTFFLGATGAFLELQGALDTIWRVTPKSSGSVLRDLIFQRFISFGLVLGLAFVLITALVVSAGLAALSTAVGATFPGGPTLWKGLDIVLSFGVITLLFALIYRVMPDAVIGWRQAWVGAGVTAFLFAVGKTLIGLYLGATSITSTYGAAGSVIVVLVWVYYSSQIVLLGAEFTKAYGDSLGLAPA